jgi:hypothetical protein
MMPKRKDLLCKRVMGKRIMYEPRVVKLLQSGWWDFKLLMGISKNSVLHQARLDLTGLARGNVATINY